VINLDAEDRKGRDKETHKIREAWRKNQWAHWCTRKRRDNVNITPKDYDEGICTRTRKTFDNSDTHERKVLTAAAVSHAANHKMRKKPVPTTCPDCKEEKVPTWDHSCWECKAFEATRKGLERPRNRMQARCAWYAEKDNKYNTTVLAHMANVRKKILEAWHPGS